MAALAAIPAWVYMASAVAGTVMTVVGQRQQGRMEQSFRESQARAKEFEAVQLEQRAGQEQAAAQRASAEEQRRAEILGSRALALAAASGAGATDPTVVDIISGIKGEGAYRAGVALYEGEERSRAARMGAKAARYEAQTGYESAKSLGRAGNIAAIGSIFSGGSQIGSMYGKYGLPSTSTPTSESRAYLPGGVAAGT